MPGVPVHCGAKDCRRPAGEHHRRSLQRAEVPACTQWLVSGCPLSLVFVARSDCDSVVVRLCVVGLVLRCSSHVIYLIEGKLSLSEHDRKLRSAIVSTQLEPNFRTKQTADLSDTVRFLARMTRHVEGSLARNIQAASLRLEYGCVSK